MKKLPRRPTKFLSVARQGAKLEAFQPSSTVRYSRGSSLTWEGSLQPTSISNLYRVRIQMSQGKRPHVHVIDPILQRRGQEPIPHTFPGNELCLYRAKYGEWNGSMFLADTILPWASLWLYFYELWHSTGEWLGGGEHPPAGQSKELEAKRVREGESSSNSDV